MIGDGTVVSVNNLSKHFGDRVKAVDGVTFDVKEREIFGFLGPNGAGKTTTIKMLTTLLKPTSGNATVCGHNISSHPNDVRASVGIVPQEYAADEDLTGRQNIMFCADLCGVPRSVSKDRTVELLDLAGLKDAKSKIERIER